MFDGVASRYDLTNTVLSSGFSVHPLRTGWQRMIKAR